MTVCYEMYFVIYIYVNDIIAMGFVPEIKYLVCNNATLDIKINYAIVLGNSEN